MGKYFKKLLCSRFTIFAAIAIASYIFLSPKPVYALPEQSSDPAPKLTGYCGDTLDKNGDPEGHNASYECTDENQDGVYDTLRISGTGRMGYLQKENEYLDRYFFYEHPKNIEVVYIDGVTNVAYMSAVFVEKFVLSDTVTRIDDHAFQNAYIEELVSNNVQEIGSYAFASSKIKEINLNAAVNIGAFAFYNCWELEKVTLGKNVVMLDENCFSHCKVLKSITIPSNVKTIGAEAFLDCPILSEITLSEGIETISGGAFYSCPSLTEIKLPESLKFLGAAFSKNDGLTELYIPGGADVETIMASYVVNDCINLKKLTYGEGITRVGVTAINCPKLDEVYFPSTLVRTFPVNAFVNCPLLKTIGPEKGYNINYAWKDEIPEWAFYELDSLETLTVGDNIKTIGKNAFFGCDNLKTINLSSKVETIKESAFSDDHKLEKINFSEKGNLTTIESKAFRECEALLSIHFPKSVKYIGDMAFLSCFELKDVRFSGDIDLDGKPFKGCVEIKSAGPLGDGNTYNMSFDNITKFPESVLSGNEYVKKVVIPDNVTEIGCCAFNDCTALTEVTIPDSVKVIEYSAFYGCTGLKELKIPSKLEYVGQNAFGRCLQLRSLTFPITLTEMYSSAIPAGCVIYGYDNSPSDLRSYGHAYVSLGEACAVYFSDNHNGNRTKKYVLLGNNVGEAPIPEVTMEGATFQCWAYDDLTAFSPKFNVGSHVSVTFYAKYYINGVPEFDAIARARELLIVGYYTKVGNNTYRVTDVSSKGQICVSLQNCKDDAASITVKDSVKIYGISCKITGIDYSAFSECENLKTLTIGKNIKKINGNAFYGCNKLKNITLKTTKLTSDGVEYNSFANIQEAVVIKVPRSKYKSYKKLLETNGFTGKVKK